VPEGEVVRRRFGSSTSLQQVRLFLAEASSMIILTDPSGVIIETGEIHELSISVGSYTSSRVDTWAEADIGTNAIGTATLQPVQTHSVQHFCREVQR